MRLAWGSAGGRRQDGLELLGSPLVQGTNTVLLLCKGPGAANKKEVVPPKITGYLGKAMKHKL